MLKVGDKPVFFTRTGVGSESELLPDKVIIYRSSSRFTSMSYAGDAKSLLIKGKASSIPDSLKPQFQKLDVIVTVGSNFHIYHKTAKFIDGYSRFCYVFCDKGEIYISEYQKRSKGSKYSSLFLVLKDKLIQADFPLNSDEGEDVVFHIPSKRINEFINIINEISKAYINSEYELFVDGNERLYSYGWFNRVYFQEKREDAPVKELMSDREAVDALDALVKIQNLGADTEVKAKKEAIRKIKTVLVAVL